MEENFIPWVFCILKFPKRNKTMQEKPSTSGHVEITILNYVLRKKKVYFKTTLRNMFSVLQYEDREKIMKHGPILTHNEQMITEIEADIKICEDSCVL